MPVNLHSVLLFNLADQVSRNYNDFGILLGTKSEDNDVISVHTSFEILIDGDHNEVVDVEFLRKRSEQFKVVLPQFEIIGMYQINTLEPNARTNSILGQIGSHIPTADLVVLLYDGEKSLCAYPSDGKQSVNTAQKLQLNILANDEVEKISTYTIANNSQYTGSVHGGGGGGSKETSSTKKQLTDHYKILSGSVDQLTIRVERILQYLQENHLAVLLLSADSESYSTYIKLQTLITHLANKVEEITSGGSAGVSDASNNVETQLITSKLSLLNSQMISLQNLRTTIAKQIIRSGNIAHAYPQRSQQLGAPPHTSEFYYSGNTA